MHIFKRPLDMPAKERLIAAVGLVFVSAGFVLFWWDGVQQPYIRDDFLYSANIISTSTVYNPKTQHYDPSSGFVGRFYYQVEKRQGGIATIKNAIDGKNTAGAITALTRTRQVSVHTGRFVPTTADTAKNEYLFAPRSLRVGESFVTRHTPYDVPITMEYVRQTKVDGLQIFQYKATYPASAQVERTTTSTSSAALPAGEGTQYRPSFEMWVEPVSGWLINIQDDTSVMVYDRATGQTLRPLSKYSAHYTDESVEQQITYARTLRRQLTFERRVAPWMFGASMLTVLYICNTFRGQLSPAVHRMLTLKRARRHAT